MTFCWQIDHKLCSRQTSYVILEATACFRSKNDFTYPRVFGLNAVDVKNHCETFILYLAIITGTATNDINYVNWCSISCVQEERSLHVTPIKYVVYYYIAEDISEEIMSTDNTKRFHVDMQARKKAANNDDVNINVDSSTLSLVWKVMSPNTTVCATKLERTCSCSRFSVSLMSWAWIVMTSFLKYFDVIILITSKANIELRTLQTTSISRRHT